MWLVEVVNAYKQLFQKNSVLSTGFQYLKSNYQSEGHGSHGNNGTILFLGSVNVPLSVISANLIFVEIS